ncbi:MAG: amidohydrolase family protein [Clostridia bacterium]|nr:amidohydrolase family protein [Clostridia bacterium]
MLALVNGRILTVHCQEQKPDSEGSFPVYDPGWIVISDSKIFAVGAGTKPPVECEKVIDLEGKVVTPGLIDAHTHLGIFEEGRPKEGDDTNEISSPVMPHLRAVDGINPRDMGFRFARENGVTCVCCLPGSANVVGGLGAALKTDGDVVDSMVVSENVGLKVAFGENPKRVYGSRKKTPTTRMAIAALLRENFVQALHWEKEKEKENYSGGDIKKDIFVKVLKGQIPLRVHAHRADDIMTAVRIAEEFNVSIILDHCTEGHFVAEEIAKRNIPVVYGPMLLGKVKQELGELTEKTPAVLFKAGVKFALTTDHPEISVKHLMLCAALSTKEGLPKEEALKAVTFNAAEILGLSHRIGSLWPGKDADIVVWSRDPFDIMSRVEMVWINGRMVYNASEDRLQLVRGNFLGV